MKKLFSAILFSLPCAVSAQNTQDDFPKEFIGNWKGYSQYFVTSRGLKRTDSVGLKVQAIAGKPDQYTWQFLIYEEGHPNDRVYLLKPSGDGKNHWLLDEQDGIVLDCYIFGNALQCSFAIKDKIYQMSLKVMNGKLYEDVATLDSKSINQTGKGTDLVPLAGSYYVEKMETGVLEKQAE